MARARDSQRSKVYWSEDFLQPIGPRCETIADVQARVDRLLRSAWFTRRWPLVARSGIEVWEGRERSRAFAQRFRGRLVVSMPTWSRTESIVLHEVAHHCSDEVHGMGVASHGWQFAAILLELVTHEMGERVGADLRASYKEKSVRYKAPQKRAPLSPERRAQLAANLATARGNEQRGRWAIVTSGDLYLSGVYNYRGVATFKRYSHSPDFAQTWVHESTALRWAQRLQADSYVGVVRVVNLEDAFTPVG